MGFNSGFKGLTARGKFCKDSNRTAEHHMLPLIL